MGPRDRNHQGKAKSGAGLAAAVFQPDESFDDARPIGFGDTWARVGHRVFHVAG
jgi:hypothetical protein